MVRPSAVAPALVPAITSPAARRSASCSLIRDPTSVWSLAWSPPTRNTPLALSSAAAAAGLSASARPLIASSLMCRMPSLVNTCSYSASTASGVPVAVVITTTRALVPPHSWANRSRTPEPQHLSSAPPMISRRPGFPSSSTFRPSSPGPRRGPRGEVYPWLRCVNQRLLAAENPWCPAAPAPGRARPRQLVRQLQQRVRGAGDDVARDVDDPSPAAPRRVPELLECLPGLDPVPFCQHADRLLDSDPRGERVLEMANRRSQAAGLRCRGPGGSDSAVAAGAASSPESSSAEIRSASAIALVRSATSESPTRQPSLVLRTTASFGCATARAVASAGYSRTSPTWVVGSATELFVAP